MPFMLSTERMTVNRNGAGLNPARGASKAMKTQCFKGFLTSVQRRSKVTQQLFNILAVNKIKGSERYVQSL